MFLSRGRMDVPYSYKQRDILFDGTTRVTQLHDGIFIGVNTFVSRFVISEPESLHFYIYVCTLYLAGLFITFTVCLNLLWSVFSLMLCNKNL